MNSFYTGPKQKILTFVEKMFEKKSFYKYLHKFDFGGINVPFKNKMSWAVKYMANKHIVSESVIKQDDF